MPWLSKNSLLFDNYHNSKKGQHPQMTSIMAFRNIELFPALLVVAHKHLPSSVALLAAPQTHSCPCSAVQSARSSLPTAAPNLAGPSHPRHAPIQKLQAPQQPVLQQGASPPHNPHFQTARAGSLVPKVQPLPKTKMLYDYCPFLSLL